MKVRVRVRVRLRVRLRVRVRVRVKDPATSLQRQFALTHNIYRDIAP